MTLNDSAASPLIILDLYLIAYDGITYPQVELRADWVIRILKSPYKMDPPRPHDEGDGGIVEGGGHGGGHGSGHGSGDGNGGGNGDGGGDGGGD